MSKSIPLTSIGIPTYNRCEMLRRSIQSALGQDYPHLEIIVADNASDDDTQSLCQKFIALDPRFRYVRAERNQGALANFKHVLNQAHGKYFMWLADDDWLDPTYVSSCVDILENNPDYTLVCGRSLYYKCGAFNVAGEELNINDAEPVARVDAFYNGVRLNGAFYGVARTKLLREIPISEKLAGDWCFIASVAFFGKIATLNTPKLHRDLSGVSKDAESLVASLGLARVWSRFPLFQIRLSLVLAADFGWESPVYSPLSKWTRLGFALRLFARRAKGEILLEVIRIIFEAQQSVRNKLLIRRRWEDLRKNWGPRAPLM